MLATAVDPDLQWAWWISLAAGLVVTIVVAALLHVLLRVVREIHTGIEGVWLRGKHVARNTATTWLINEASRRAGDLDAELAGLVAPADGRE